MNQGLACLTCVFVICVFLQKNAYMIASGIICLIYILCAIVLFFGVREQKGEGTSSVCREEFHAVFSASLFTFAFCASASRALPSRLQAHIVLSEHEACDGTRTVREAGRKLPLYLFSVHGTYRNCFVLLFLAVGLVLAVVVV